MKKLVRPLIMMFVAILCLQTSEAQHSIAREWNEQLLDAIRRDFARPTSHSRNLFHTSFMMYDIWAVYSKKGDTYFLGKDLRGFQCAWNGIAEPEDVDAAIEEAISYAMYRLLYHRFLQSPGAFFTITEMQALMIEKGYDPAFTSTDYSTGSPAAFGNYIAAEVIQFGLQDASNEQNDYENLYYEPVNESLIVEEPGNPDITDPNRWQPLTLEIFIDQSGNPIPGSTPDFLGPEWGKVVPFALQDEDLNIYERDGEEYWVYHDPGPPPYIDTEQVGGLSEEYKWGFSLVSIWASHLDPADETLIDISPATIGNNSAFPTDIEGLQDFYKYIEGGDQSQGWDLNPATGLPYEPQMVKRADYGRVLAEFWADGPDSETPPGHWFTLLNYVSDHPQLVKQFKGEGPVLSDLEWDIKSYFIMGGTVHDACVSAWGVKGWYDYIRPVSAIRYMAEQGQSSDPNLPNYAPAGIPLVPGYIELVGEGDPLVGDNNENLNKIKLYTWRGPDYIDDPEVDIAGVDWILADNWWPYQRPSFITPPFAGYVSGHSTFSRAAAEAMTLLTGDPFFPGGMGEFNADQNAFLVFEAGPSQDMVLQWATYRDASDQCSLSRIWGGIHPPADDIPGRRMGIEIGVDAFNYAESYFYVDRDNDGYYSFEDCDDDNFFINPGAEEICDGIDNNCDNNIDEDLEVFSYYIDRDNDGYGDASSVISLDTCLLVPPAGYVANNFDCNDDDENVNPDAAEICDDIDNNCNGIVNENIELFRYYADSDQDGFGNMESFIDTCIVTAPNGFVIDFSDCDDNNNSIYPGATDVPDNNVDEDCSGSDLFEQTKVFPNPVTNELTIHYNISGMVEITLVSMDARTVIKKNVMFDQNQATFSVNDLPQGIYVLEFVDQNEERLFTERVLKID